MKKNIKIILYLIVIFTGLSSFTQGQVTFFSAKAEGDSSGENWGVQVLTSAVKATDVISVVILDGKTGKTVDYGQRINTTSPGAPDKITGFQIPSIKLDKNSPYTVIVTVNKRKENGDFDKVVSSSIELSLSVRSPQTQAQTPVESSIPLQPKASKTKKDSDFYFALEAIGSKGKKTFYSTDIKVEPRFGPGQWNYSPFFHLISSTKPDADPDKMDIGFRAWRKYEVDSFRIVSVFPSIGGKIESERDFDNANLLFDPNLKFTTKPFKLCDKCFLIFEPFIGTEVGKNLKSPVPAAEGNAVARIFGGTYMLLDARIEKPLIQGITWETTYTRRWLLKNELGYKTDDDDNLILAKYGKSPRDYVTSKVSFEINDFFSPFIEYEWGEVPPSYKLVNHSFKFGFSYKFSLDTKKN